MTGLERKGLGILWCSIIISLVMLVSSGGVFAASGGSAPSSPAAEWSLSTQVTVPASVISEVGTRKATADRVDSLVSKLKAQGMTVSKGTGKTDERGTTYTVTASGVGTVDNLREVLYSAAKPRFSILRGGTEIEIEGGASGASEVAVVLESNPSTGYRWYVAEDSGMVEAKPGKYEKHTLGRGVPARQTIYLAQGKGRSSSVKLVYKRAWEPTVVSGKVALKLSALPATVNLSNPNASETAIVMPASSKKESASSGLKTADLPVAFDWRTQGIVTPVRDQGTNCGSCWAFGTVGVMESALGKAGIKGKNLSEQYLINCNEDGWDCGGGFTAHKYHYDTRGINQTAPGAVLDATLPYTSGSSGEAGSCDKSYAKAYTLSGWNFVTTGTDPEFELADDADIKAAIYAHGPVTAGVCVGDSGWESYTGGVFDTEGDCGGSTDHQIILVGWNDTEGYWILRNSWGADWGINGYMHIAYGTSRVGEGPSWVTVNAGATTYTLMVAKAGVGTGTVAGSGISCGVTCNKTYKSGTSVTLTARAATGSSFAGWGGDCASAGTATTCTLTMDADKSVTATFITPTYTLDVTKAGTGGGTVTGSSGIGCGSTCSGTYAWGTTVTLSQAASTGSAFAGWSGACKGMGACRVRMTADKSVGATFNTCTYTINPTNKTFSTYRAGAVSVVIVSQKGCAKPSASIDSGYESWLHAGTLQYNVNSGRGSVRISADANTGVARSGTATIAGRTFTVNQAAKP